MPSTEFGNRGPTSPVAHALVDEYLPFGTYRPYGAPHGRRGRRGCAAQPRGTTSMSRPAAPTDELTALEQAIAALEGQRVVLGDLVVETALAPLIEKRDRLLAASVGEQLKLVTVLFADLVDSTPLAQRLDPEDLQQVMSRYFAAVRQAVEAEGGVVEKFIGDAVMAVFGLYRSKEDDATRAVRAGLAMLTALEELNVQIGASLGVHLQMRVGFDTG
jgi:class 3 adenylate cyclase